MTISKNKPELGRYRAFLLDMDGVLVHGWRPLPGAAEALRKLRSHGRVVVFSNNSTRSRRAFAQRLQEVGLEVAPEEIVNSAYVVAQYLRELNGPAKVYCIGEEGLREELELAGHRLVPPEEAQFVIAGMDREFDYQKLAEALRALLRGARLIATNTDATFPTPEGLLPGAGAIVGALRGMGFEPEAIVGKPSPIAFRVALSAAGARPEECLVIGDRLETDILGAQRAGLDSVLVLSGVTSQAELEGSPIKPTWVVRDLRSLVEDPQR